MGLLFLKQEELIYFGFTSFIEHSFIIGEGSRPSSSFWNRVALSIVNEVALSLVNEVVLPLVNEVVFSLVKRSYLIISERCCLIWFYYIET